MKKPIKIALLPKYKKNVSHYKIKNKENGHNSNTIDLFLCTPSYRHIF